MQHGILTKAIESKQEATVTDIAQYQALSYWGLLCLSRLCYVASSSIGDDILCTIICSASLTNLDDPWTFEPSHREACKLLNRLPALNYASDSEVLLTRILQEHIKPAFAKTKKPKLTQQSRKALHPPPVATLESDDDVVESKPWKYQDMYIPTVLRWVLTKIQNLHVNCP